MRLLSFNGWLQTRSAVCALSTTACLVLMGASTAAAQPRNELYVLNQKPASVSVLDAADWKIIHTISLDPEPTAAVIHAQGRFLFVLHRGFIRPDGRVKEAQSELVVYDLESRSRLNAIPLGWNTTDLVFSPDGRYLLSVSARANAGRKGSAKSTARSPSSTRGQPNSSRRCRQIAWGYGSPLPTTRHGSSC